MGQIVNQATLAEIIGVSAKSIFLWQAEGLPVAVKGVRGKPSSYDTAKVIAWYVARASGKSAETPKDRLARVQSERIELEMDRSRGALVQSEEIDPAWAGVVIATRQAMLAIPSAVVPILAHGEEADQMRIVLTEAIEDALTKLAARAVDESGVAGVGPGDVGAVRAAVEDAPVRMGRSQSTASGRIGDAGPVPVRDDAVPA